MAGYKILETITAAALSALLFLPGCGTDTAPAKPLETYGVANLETLVKAHPSYVEYFRLEKEYENLLQRYQKERTNFLRLSDSVKKIRETLSFADEKRMAEEEYNAKVKIRENQLNQEMQNLYREISDRHQAQFVRPKLSDTNSGDNTKIANLHLKLKLLNLSDDEKVQAEQDLKDLLNGRYAEIPQNDWTEEEKAEFAGKLTEAKKEMESYAAGVAKEILERQQKERAAVAAGSLPDPSHWNKQWEARIQSKQKEMAAEKEKIMEDIRGKAAVIGTNKHLDLIFTSYRVNVKAEDVTDDIVNELIKIK